MACLLGDVDAHDAFEQRMQFALGTERGALHVIDRVFAPEHEHEEQGREPAGDADDPAGSELEIPRQPGNLEAGAVDELLEHQRVLRLLDDLVIRVAKLRAVIGQQERVLEEPALEDALELQPCLHVRGDAVQPDARAYVWRLAPVPLGRAEPAVGLELAGPRERQIGAASTLS